MARTLWKMLFVRAPSKNIRRNNRLLRLEVLEDRTLLSVVTVDRLTDNKPFGGGEGGSGMGDLRWCVIESLFQADIINFAVTGTINLAAVLPALTRSVSLEGPGADLMTVRRDTGGNYRIFAIAENATVSLSGLTISNGHTSEGGGGGILNFGTLTVNNSIISANDGSQGFGAFGGGIRNSGTLAVNNSTVSANSAVYGGGIDGSVTLTNSTISGNSAQFGGGIYSEIATSIINSTISENSAASGGGIWVNANTLTIRSSTVADNSATSQGGGINANSAMVARNTIIAGNTAPAGPDVYGNLGSQGHNLISNPQDMSGWVDTDLLHVDPVLDVLQDNGGPTSLMALLPGSPAIDAGDNTDAPDWDQRGPGFPRIVNGIIDIGAFEVQAEKRAVPALLLASVRATIQTPSLPAAAAQALQQTEETSKHPLVASPRPSPTEPAAADLFFAARASRRSWDLGVAGLRGWQETLCGSICND